MNEEAISALTEKACASIRYRVRKEILEENPDINDYLEEIISDRRVIYVFTWQRPDGFLGQSFHGGWIPDAKLKFYNTGAEAGLRFLSEMGLPKDYPVVAKCLKALLKDNWNPDPWKWGNVYQPEIGLYGGDYLRAVVFAYFGIEEHAFIKTEMQRALEAFCKIQEIPSIESITGSYRNKLYYKGGIALPDIYQLRLLAFTKGWRNKKNTAVLAKALRHFSDLSPVPQIYIRSGSQLIAPAGISPHDLNKKSLSDFLPIEWFAWMRTMEYFARTGAVKEVPAFMKQVNELKEMLEKNNGFFPFRPATSTFEKWNVYAGLAMEDSWAKERWKYDLTFRSLLILKYAGML
jgi:hypothetical protein